MSRLRAGAMVLAYKQEDYIAYCLRPLAPHVDHVLVLFSEEPWVAYNSAARRDFTRPDATRDILERLRRELDNVTVIEGVWADEAAMRTHGLRRLRALGTELCLLVDGDEIYPDGMVARLLEEVEAAGAPGTVYRARSIIPYRRFDYVVDSTHRAAVAVHLAPRTAFPRRRLPTGPRRDLSDAIHHWHMGYVLDDDRMWEKINTFGHAHEVLPGWFEEKWLNWTPETRDLHRKPPASHWRRTVRIDPRTLPAALHDHPFFPHGSAGPAGGAR